VTRLRSRTGGRQTTEVAIAVISLNRRLELGRLEYVRLSFGSNRHCRGGSSWTENQHLPREPQGRRQNEKNSRDFEHIYCRLTGYRELSSIPRSDC
jgi:hypothetical protein